LYPLLEKYISANVANHSREEHQEVKNDLYKLDSMTVFNDDKEYDQLITKSMEVISLSSPFTN